MNRPNTPEAQLIRRVSAAKLRRLLKADLDVWGKNQAYAELVWRAERRRKGLS